MFRPAPSSMGRRLLLIVALVGLAAIVAFATTTLARERQYRAYVTQGDSALSSGRTSEAVEAFSGAIALRPDLMLAWFKRGETYHRRGELQAALRDLLQALTLDPTAVRAMELAGDVHYELGRFDRAAEHYDRYLALDDRDAAVLYKLALTRFHDGQLPQAATTLRRTIALAPQMPEAHYLLGLCLAQSGQRADAATAFARAIELAPTMLPAREELAGLHANAGRHADEVRQLEALAALDPDRVERLITLGLAYARWGRTDLAVTTIVRAAERASDRPEALVALGHVWWLASDGGRDRVALDKALAASSRAVEQSPSAEGMALLGRCLLAAGEARRAHRWLQQAAAHSPVNPAVLADLARAAERVGRLGPARDALIRQAALTGDGASTPAQQAELASRIATLSERLGERDTATTWLERAVRDTPGDTRIVARLSESYLRAGRPDLAREIVERGLARAPDAPELLALRRRLAGR